MSRLIERRRTFGAAAPYTVTRAGGSGTVLAGYAAVFYVKGDKGTEYELAPGVVERITPEAFTRTLRENKDIRALYQHNWEHVLGRTTAGTLRLSVTSRGLHYEIDAPDTTTGRDVVNLVRRQDISGASFAFSVVEERFQDEGDKIVRLIRDVDLWETSIVSRPAYLGSSAGLRAEAAYGTAYPEWKVEADARERLLKIREWEAKR